MNRSNNESTRCSRFRSEHVDAAAGRLGLTVDPRNGPVASDAAGNAGQIEDKGPGVGLGVVIGGRDVDAVDVPAHALADLRLLGYESRGVVVDVYQIDLQRAGAGGGRRTWQQRDRWWGGVLGEKIASRREGETARGRSKRRPIIIKTLKTT